MIYVPSYQSNNCLYIYSTDILRKYDYRPTNNSNVPYTDYYLKSHYIFNTGSQSFGQYSTLPTCIDNSRITTDFYYRNDLSEILVIFFIILLVCIYFPYRIISRLFGRWLKW